MKEQPDRGDMANISDWLVPVLTFLGTVFAGAGLKWIEGKLKAAKDKDDIATNLRDELRGEVKTLRQEAKDSDAETVIWKAKYYEAYEKLLLARVEITKLKDRIAGKKTE
mgnify:CR=1 FL=1